MPLIERDHPPIVGNKQLYENFRVSSFLGRILWARRLYKRIRISYMEFMKRLELNENPIMKKITENFLMISNDFCMYELLYHRQWFVNCIFH